MKLNGMFFAIILLGVQMMHAGPMSSPAHSPRFPRRGTDAARAHAADAQERASAAEAVQKNDDPASNDYDGCPKPVRFVFGCAAAGCLTWAAYLQWCEINGGYE